MQTTLKHIVNFHLNTKSLILGDACDACETPVIESDPGYEHELLCPKCGQVFSNGAVSMKNLRSYLFGSK